MEPSPHTTTMHKYNLQTTSKHTLLWVVFLGLCTSWFFMYYLRKNDKIQQYSKKNKELAIQTQTLEKTKMEREKLEQAVKQLRLSTRSAEQAMSTSPSKTIQQQMIDIARKARTAGLQLNSYIAQKTKQKNSLKKQRVKYNLTGPSSNIAQFINTIKADAHLFACKNFAFNNEKKENANLECTLQFLTV